MAVVLSGERPPGAKLDVERPEVVVRDVIEVNDPV
jgi:hypothetical protein